jgi:pimeloyl-ACP methyl ester carboxylesterase
MMNNYRYYGKKPYRIAVVHGGPGAPGSVAAIARELSVEWGVLEPLQTKTTLEAQIEELYETLSSNGDIPVILIGHSWGAWLSYLLTVRHPEVVSKLILVGSGPFKAEYVKILDEIRTGRMSNEEKAECDSIIEYLYSEEAGSKSQKLARLGEIIDKVDSYEPETIDTDSIDIIPVEGDTFQKVWGEAAILRKNGLLLEYGRQIQCSVVAIHGAYDPHPAEGVKVPLSGVIKEFRFFLLEKCGHSPWKERYAREEFYHILRNEIADTL